MRSYRAWKRRSNQMNRSRACKRGQHLIGKRNRRSGRLLSGRTMLNTRQIPTCKPWCNPSMSWLNSVFGKEFLKAGVRITSGQLGMALSSCVVSKEKWRRNIPSTQDSTSLQALAFQSTCTNDLSGVHASQRPSCSSLYFPSGSSSAPSSPSSSSSGHCVLALCFSAILRQITKTKQMRSLKRRSELK